MGEERTSQPRKKLALHEVHHVVGYEIIMLVFTVMELARSDLIEFAKAALSESFAIHLRCLIEFLARGKQSGDADAHVTDEFAQEWNEVAKTAMGIRQYKKIFDPIWKEISVKVGHVSHERVVEKEKNIRDEATHLRRILPLIKAYLSMQEGKGLLKGRLLKAHQCVVAYESDSTFPEINIHD